MDEKLHVRDYGSRIDRRNFLWKAGVVGAGLMLAPTAFADDHKVSESEYINVALIGLGEQSGRLMDAITTSEMPAAHKLRFAAVCDIWPLSLIHI